MAVSAAAALALSACATERRTYDSLLATWQGAHETELVRAWGAPASRHEAGTRRFLVFQKEQRLHLPGGAAGYPSAGPTPGPAGMDVALRCATTFELQDARVVGWSYQGNWCSTTAPAK